MKTIASRVRRSFVALAVLGLWLGGLVTAAARPIALTGATLIDATGREPLENAVVVIDGGRIKAAGPASALKITAGTDRIDVAGKYIIPGLMDANVHLFLDIEPDVLIDYEGRYEELILEAAQVALRNGVTTVFDTWGPVEELVAVRDRINAGAVPGSRVYVAGTIIGFDGPFSFDFWEEAPAILGKEFTDRFNDKWTRGMGRNLLLLTPQEVQAKVADYIKKERVDFIKYGASGHHYENFIAFSELTQKLIVEAATAAGMNSVAHTTHLESLRMSVGAGANLMVHCLATGDGVISPDIIATMAKRRMVCGVGLLTGRAQAYEESHLPRDPRRPPESAGIVKLNLDNLVKGGVLIALATDGGLFAPSAYRGQIFGEMLRSPDANLPFENGQFLWLQAARERGLSPMLALQAATRNIAIAYGLDKEIGTLEPGKRADLVVLKADPFADPRNFRAISMVMKDGVVVERDKLPTKRIFSRGDHQE